jgi:acyl carrier protein
MEKILAGLWQKALRQDAVGVHDNFFDLGADSLMLTTLHRQLQNELKREFPITDLFQFPTIAALSAHLEKPADDGSRLAGKAKSRAELQRAAMGGSRRPGGAK